MSWMRSRSLAAVWVAIATVRAAGAQAPRDAHWSFEGNHGRYCISYLVDPALVAKLLPSDAKPAPAGTGAGLHPFLTRTVQDEPRFAQWIPAAICVARYDRVTADGKVLAQGKKDHPLIIVTNAVAVQSPRGIPEATDLLLDVMSDQRSLQRAGDDVGLEMGGITVTSRIRIEGDDPDVAMEVDGAIVHWSGHATGEPSVGTTHSMSFGYAARRSASLMIREEWTPETSRLMVGALQISGRNTLAKALGASPVRAVGPEEVGGTTTWTFHIQTKR
ncbi:MAG TPA: hypothetical protein VGM20_02870 [Gemmatimonadales bacterium]|jgi:hypothetical protein